MDITFSSTHHHTRTLISCTPLSSSPSSHSSSLSPPHLRSIRRQFLGCGHNLRPSGLRTRRKCRKPGFHFQSSRFVIRASLNSQTVLVCIVVATLSVVSLAYLNYLKRNKNLKEEPGPSNLSLYQRGKDVKSHIAEGQTLVFEDLDKGKSQEESKYLMGTEIENSHVGEDSETSPQFQEPALTNEETFATIVPEASPQFQEPALTNEETFATIVSESLFADVIASSTFDYETDSKLHATVINNNSSAVSVSTETLHAEVEELEKPNHGLGEEGESTGDNGFFRHPVREELHTFYEEKQDVTKSIANFNGRKKAASNASVMEGKIFSSLMREIAEGDTSFACYKEVPLLHIRNSDKSAGFLKDKERRIMPHKGHHFSYQNGWHASKKLSASEQLSLYSRLLRDGRLIDCIELLEDMERMSLLDMNKVYHSRFFETCKSKKAVKEAFRFTKLISNPTLSTFNMLLSVCASAQDSKGAFQVLRLVQEAGLKADCKLYTTLIASCAKSGKVDAMFEVFHEMVNAKVEPNLHTYGALIDGCGKAGQVAKAFGAYGILRSKNVKPDRVVFNALITACGHSGAVDRAFDVLAEMRAETQPIDPDHITVGALIKACANSGQIDRAQEVYKMVHKYDIKGTPEVYTIAVSICSQTGDWEFARNVFNDMTRKGVVPDEMFLSALVDVAGHAGELDAAFEVLQEIRTQGIRLGIVSYSSLMGACSNAKNWKKALELYEDIKSMRLNPTVSTMNALLTALCDGDQLQKAMEVLSEMKKVGLCPNTITYSILLVASEKKDDLEVGLVLLSQAKENGLAPNLLMSRCLISMCLRRFKKACKLGEPVLSLDSGRPEIDTEWTSLALMIYRETIVAGLTPSMETFSQVLGCLQLPHEVSLRSKLFENLGVCAETPNYSNLSSLVNGFGEYDPRAFSLLEEAASLGILPAVSFKHNPIVVDARSMQIHTAEVYLLTVLKGLKNRHAAGARLPSISILLSVEKPIPSSMGEKTVNLAGRIGQAVAACLRRMGLHYQGSESFGKIRINGLAVKRWFTPKLTSPFSGLPAEMSSSQSRLGKGISYQQRDIRTGNLCLE